VPFPAFCSTRARGAGLIVVAFRPDAIRAAASQRAVNARPQADRAAARSHAQPRRGKHGEWC